MSAKMELQGVTFNKMSEAEVRDAMMLATSHPQIFDAILNVVQAMREDWITLAKQKAQNCQDASREVGGVDACDMLIVNFGEKREQAIFPDGRAGVS